MALPPFFRALRRPDSSVDRDEAPLPTRRPPEIELTIAWAFPTYADGSIGEESFSLTLYNRRHHAVHWSSASIELSDGRHMPVTPHVVPPGMALPMRVEAQNHQVTLVAVEAVRLAGVDLTKPLIGFATLGTGESFRTAPWIPDSKSVA